MSLFCRPDSPPPRSPSPDVMLAPLPPPRRTSARPPRLSLQSTDCRPKMDKPQRSLASTRSYGDLRQSASPRSASRSRAIVSAPATPRSFAPSSPSGSSFRRAHRRTLSSASPYRSPPASPTLSSPPPPVPPIPAFVLSPTDKKPVIRAPAPTRILLPEWEHFPIAPDLASPRKPRTPTSARRTGMQAPTMTCSTFFALHNQSQRPNQVVAL
ncbi:hypothetical protein C8F04DRAFT_587834 [Mycena alexandri]|uniref:Uncharacterized protein n=1 Tax=Mycena alexandri TaxID=1745969 RepID=A0AAD6XDM4_9AGAR|nr:hypothetical protein C8F04DRAFT_587834 [Mycena alexandri]